MPSQLIHLDVVAAAAGGRSGAAGGRAARPGEDLPLGDLLLGGIAPDAWSVAGLSRQATHFWTLEDDASGAARMARAHATLADPRRARGLTSGERAYLAGYVCHLVTDEQWTFTVYRPFFGRRSPFGASPEGMRTQRALQAALEQDLRDERAVDLAVWLEAVAGADAPAVLPFLDGAAVERWRDLQLAGARLPTSRAAFSHVTALTDRPGAADLARAMLEEDWEALTAAARAYVPVAAVAAFRARAVAACAAVLAAWR
jgi:hypothetical protein